MKQISIIIPLRNRNENFIINQIESLLKLPSYEKLEILLIDYGSDLKFSSAYKNISTKYNVSYYYINSAGLPWNKCYSINFGVKKASTNYIVTSDADMTYDQDVFSYILNNINSNDFYHYQFIQNVDGKGLKSQIST